MVVVMMTYLEVRTKESVKEYKVVWKARSTNIDGGKVDALARDGSRRLGQGRGWNGEAVAR